MISIFLFCCFKLRGRAGHNISLPTHEGNEKVKQRRRIKAIFIAHITFRYANIWRDYYLCCGCSLHASLVIRAQNMSGITASHINCEIFLWNEFISLECCKEDVFRAREQSYTMKSYFGFQVESFCWGKKASTETWLIEIAKVWNRTVNICH